LIALALYELIATFILDPPLVGKKHKPNENEKTKKDPD
jgi:hypothetical protein